MTEKQTSPEPLIECYMQGHRRLLTLAELLQALKETQFVWVLPLDLYYYHVEGYQKLQWVNQVVPPSALAFGYRLQTRGQRALTLNDLQMLEPADENLTDANFHARAARFNRLFRGLPPWLRPFAHGCYFDRGRRARGYKMKSERTWIVVIGEAENQGILDDDCVDWNLLSATFKKLIQENSNETH